MQQGEAAARDAHILRQSAWERTLPPLLVQLHANTHPSGAGVGVSTRASATHPGDPDGVTGPAPGVVGIWGGSQ